MLYKANTLTAFAAEAAGIASSFGPYFTSLLAISFNAVKGKACTSYRGVLLIYHLVVRIFFFKL